MNGMVAANAETVPIAGNDPDAEFGAGGFQARCNGRRPSMYGVHSIGVHIIREAAAAAYAGNDHDIFPGNA